MICDPDVSGPTLGWVYVAGGPWHYEDAGGNEEAWFPCADPKIGLKPPEERPGCPRP
jgi:hypothetical protein